ncbi:MAG: thiolase family protein [Ruminiclostridium sp.]|nr:thiolase family protein [Ruminiclostridium sp.]
MSRVFIAGGARTPIGKTGGMLKKFLPEQMAALVLNKIAGNMKLQPDVIDLVVLGNAAGPGGNIARVSALEAGWPHSIPGVTVDVQCGSGLASIMWAADGIRSGQADIVIAGGVESTSMAPKRQFNPIDPRFKGEGVYYERAPFSTPSIGDPEMGEAAENVAKLMDIPRKDMDEFALSSHSKAYAAHVKGVLKDAIIPVNSDGKVMDMDESIRPALTFKLLDRMPPVFVKGGKITAGNSCLKHDGAAAILVASEKAVEKYDLTPEAELIGAAIAAIDPNIFPLSPVASVKKLIDKFNIPLEGIDAFEINEAFAVKVLACCKELCLDLNRINILGGALAYGHPYGASGAVILLHLLEALKYTGGNYGIASIGAVGGQGISILIKSYKRDR